MEKRGLNGLHISKLRLKLVSTNLNSEIQPLSMGPVSKKLKMAKPNLPKNSEPLPKKFLSEAAACCQIHLNTILVFLACHLRAYLTFLLQND